MAAPDSFTERYSLSDDSIEFAHWLHLLFICSCAVAVMLGGFLAFEYFAIRSLTLERAVGFGFTAISAATGYLFYRLRRPVSGWNVLVMMLFGSVTTFAYINGGMNAPSIMFYFPMVAAVAVVLGRGAAVVFGTVCVVALGVFAWAEANALLPPIPFVQSPWRRATIFALAVVMVVVIMWFHQAHQAQRRHALRSASDRFQTIFDSSETPAVIVRLSDRVFTECNEAFCKLFRHSRDEVIDRTSLDLKLFRTEADRNRDFNLFLATGRVVNAECDMLTASGDVRRVLRSLTGIEVSGEQMVIVQILDITERKRAEDELRANRRLLEVVIDAIPLAIFAKDKESNYVMVNQGMADFLGQTKDAILHRHTSDLPAPDATRKKSLKDDQWVYSRREVLDQPLAMLQRPDGVYVPFHSIKLPLFAEDGELIGLLGVNRDITSERRAQEELRASRRLLEIVIDSIPMHIFVKDAQGDYVVVNQRMADFYGMTKQRVIEGGLSTLPISEVTRNRARAEDASVFASRKPLVMEDTRCENPHGILVPVHTIKAPLFGDDGALVGVLGVVRDTSEERRAADALRTAQRALEDANVTLEKTVELRTAELRRANAELGGTLENLVSSQAALVRAEKLAALGRLVAGVAHELNTPIGNSLLSASTLADRTAEFVRAASFGDKPSTQLSIFIEDTQEASQILLRNLEKAGEIIRSFKQVAVDQASSQRRAFALHEIVDEVMLAHRPMLRNARVEIRTDVPTDLRLDSYPGPLGQVIGNLITNAVLHGYEGKDQGVIDISAKLRDAQQTKIPQVEIVVRDYGCGIPDENLRRVFDPFFTTRMGRGGTGLGLGICHTIVTETLAGTINIESVLGTGTRVIISIPITAPKTATAEALN